MIAPTQSVPGASGLPGDDITQVSDALPTNVSATPDVPGGPGDAGITTCTSYTLIGADGNPTVMETTFIMPGTAPGNPSGASNALPTDFPSQITGIPDIPHPDGPFPGAGGSTTSTSYTVLGSDGLPTVVDTTWVVPGPFNTGPIGASNALPTGFPGQITAGPNGQFPGGEAVTTCTSYTVLGPDGLPTVIDTTWVVPGPANTQSLTLNPNDASNALPAGFPVPGQITGLPGSPSQIGPVGAGGEGAVTTCATYTYLGADGLPSVVESTWVLTGSGALPAATSSLGFPSFIPQESGASHLPQGIPPVSAGNAVVTTAVIIGPDGNPTPVVQTVLVPPGPTAPSGPVVQTGDLNTLATKFPSLSDYGAQLPGAQTLQPSVLPFPPVVSVGGVVQASDADSGAAAGTLTDPAGVPVITSASGLPLLPYGAPVSGSAQLPGGVVAPEPSDITLWPASGIPASGVYGSVPPVPATEAVSSPCLTTTLQTSTWTNLIPEQTTTYTMKFPLTTLVTVTVPSSVPARRALRRQEK